MALIVIVALFGLVLCTTAQNFLTTEAVNDSYQENDVKWLVDSCWSSFSQVDNTFSEYTSKEKFIHEEYFRTNMPKQLSRMIQEDPKITVQEIEAKCAEHFDLNRPMPHEALIHKINEKGTWKAEMPLRFQGFRKEEAQYMMGTIMENAFKNPPKSEEMKREEEEALFQWMEQSETKTLPENFDARRQWPMCETIGNVRDQAACGSCWAFGSTEAFNDRLCIASKGTASQLMSVQDTTSCCNFRKCFSFGCKGGHPHAAWTWFMTSGVASGGDYEDMNHSDTCWPYELPKCNHHTKVHKHPECPKKIAKTPKCEKSCLNKKYKSKLVQKDAHFAAKVWSLSSVEDVKKDLMMNGPVTGAFVVYNDFLAYKSGVYQKTHGAIPLGGHAIKVIGWGKEDGVDYWLCVNSWNRGWGDKGTFKIKMGDCGIDDMMGAGKVNFPNQSEVVAELFE
eukprot:Platyproteum_vivax@DN5935_c0_g1_i2.p1